MIIENKKEYVVQYFDKLISKQWKDTNTYDFTKNGLKEANSNLRYLLKYWDKERFMYRIIERTSFIKEETIKFE